MRPRLNFTIKCSQNEGHHKASFLIFRVKTMLQVSVHEYQRRPALSQIFSIQESMELAKKSQESHLHSGVIKPGKLLFDRGDF